MDQSNKLTLSGSKDSKTDTNQYVMSNSNSLGRSQTLHLSSGVYSNYKISPRIVRDKKYDNMSQADRKSCIQLRESQFLNKKNDKNYGELQMKFKMTDQDTQAMLLLDIHKSNTPQPVIYYPNPNDVKINPQKPSSFFYSSSSKNDEVKAAGGFETLLALEDGGGSRHLKDILAKRAKSDIQQKLKDRVKSGELKLNNVLTEKKTKQKYLSMHERSQIMMNPHKFINEDVNATKYKADKLAQHLIQNAKTERNAKSVMGKLSGVIQ